MKTPREFTIRFDRETDGRWIAEVIELAGVMAYGNTRESAQNAATVLALRVLADELEQQADGSSDGEFAVEFSRNAHADV
jgi:predicted RNase H-like HicB family nuclease